MVLLNCSSPPFPFFFSRSCCQCCFSGKFPAGLHDGLGRVLQTAGCLLRADTRAGSGPQPGVYSRLMNPAAFSLGELGTMALPWCEGSALGSHGEAKRYFVAEEAIIEVRNFSLLPVVVFQCQSLTSLYRMRVFRGENWEVICFSWQPFLITPRLLCGCGELEVKGMMEPGWRGSRTVQDRVCRLCLFSCKLCARAEALRWPGEGAPCPEREREAVEK